MPTKLRAHALELVRREDLGTGKREEIPGAHCPYAHSCTASYAIDQDKRAWANGLMFLDDARMHVVFAGRAAGG